MPTSLFQYEMLPTTWFYLSALIIIVTFFKFNRLLSIRNFDLIAVILFSPGLLYLAMGDNYHGYIWIYVVGFLFFCRLWLDSFLVRRPLLEPNLATSGLVFGLVTMLLFLIPSLIYYRGDRLSSGRTLRLEQILSIRDMENSQNRPLSLDPGYLPFKLFAERVNKVFTPSEAIRKEILSAHPNQSVKVDPNERRNNSFVRDLSALLSRTLTGKPETEEARVIDSPIADEQTDAMLPFAEGIITEKFAALADEFPTQVPLATEPEETDVPHQSTGAPDVKTLNQMITEEENRQALETPSQMDDTFLIILVVLIQFGITAGLIIIGHCHFGNFKCGAAAALIYLLLPYVNQMTGRVDHFLPGMLLVLAVAIYRRPIFSGFLIGLAGSLIFYPFFLLPLWYSFYWKRGSHRFTIGVVSAVLMMGLLLLFSPVSEIGYAEQLAAMFGKHSMCVTDATGLWAFFSTNYRIPVIALFMVTVFGLLIWPSRKSLANLLSCSALVMLGAQFWMGHEGGLYMGWFLPLLILTLFRPNIEDKVAESVVIEV